MPTIVVSEPYTDVLKNLGDIEQLVNEALRQYTVQRVQQHLLELQEKVRAWEDRYGCSYDLFAFRTATDEALVRQLDANLATSQWEADLLSWEFHTTELREWQQRLRTLLTA